MYKTHLIKIYHSYTKWKKYVDDFLKDIWKTLEWKKMIFWINFSGGEIFYSYTSTDEVYSAFESQFYTYFNDFQLIADEKWVWNYDKSRTVIWELTLENSWFYPFKYSTTDNTEFVFNMFRSFENFSIIKDKVWVFTEIKPLHWESFKFFIKSKYKFMMFKLKLTFTFFKYMLNHKIQKWRKELWDKYYKYKLDQELFETKYYIIVQWETKNHAEAKLKWLFNNFLVFKNYPLNQFKLNIIRNIAQIKPFWISEIKNNYICTNEEISSIFHFPNKPSSETSLLKVTAKKLSLPIWVPTFDFDILENGEIIPKNYPIDLNIVWTSDFRSIKVPVWIYDEDRLRHLYIIWKTWTWKSKFLTSMVIDDLKHGKWIWLIDPHGDLIEEVISHIPPERMKDVIIFDPTDEQFPFCFNPLDIKKTESKQILAKWFIDIFYKFFWANWNAKLEHVLRMIFLALLDKPNSTLFDIIRALTDKDFRYDMIEHIKDDVVRNFWTNEFAGWSQQFNTEAIMPILNKVWQLLSVDILKNIFSSHENKLDFAEMMNESKILLVKLPKWKLQAEIMWFLWAIFVTKIFQAAMWRQWMSKNDRTPFFLYVDEFQNFATDTFWEILSEARKYWLSLSVAHQFIKQIPPNLSDALFWNVWTLISFRISSEDAIYMEKHFDPYIKSYDLANLNQREFYCKLLVKWQVKDPFSLKSIYVPDRKVPKDYVQKLYELSRSKYARSLLEAKKKIIEEHKDIVEKLDSFAEPII